jgi:flagellar assembly factor FliW
VRLDVHTAEDTLVLVVANPAESGTTMNLLAPIVVNATSGASAQIILDGQDFPLRAQLSSVRAA